MVGEKRKLENSGDNTEDFVIKRLKEYQTQSFKATGYQAPIEIIQETIDNDNDLLLKAFLEDFPKKENIFIPVKIGKEDRNLSLLFYCSYKGAFNCIKYLIDECKMNAHSRDQAGSTLLHLLGGNNPHEIFEYLVDVKKLEIEAKDYDGVTPLNSAASQGRDKVVELLLSRGALIEAANNNGWTPLNSAAYMGRDAVVKLLLDKGANIEAANNYGSTPLNSAASQGRDKVVELLLAKNALICVANNEGLTPLNRAADEGHAGVLKLLLARGALINASDEYGWTPLNFAASRGFVEVVELLLASGAFIDTANNEGKTPLFYAAKDGHDKIVKLLLDRGANIEAADECGWTPLSAAADEGHDGIVKLLLDHNANTEVTDIEGQTPLNIAAYGGDDGVVKLLLERGAKIEAADKNGLTPLDSAASKCCVETVKLLLLNGAVIKTENDKRLFPVNKAGEEVYINYSNAVQSQQYQLKENITEQKLVNYFYIKEYITLANLINNMNFEGSNILQVILDFNKFEKATISPEKGEEIIKNSIGFVGEYFKSFYFSKAAVNEKEVDFLLKELKVDISKLPDPKEKEYGKSLNSALEAAKEDILEAMSKAKESLLDLEYLICENFYNETFKKIDKKIAKSAEQKQGNQPISESFLALQSEHQEEAAIRDQVKLSLQEPEGSVQLGQGKILAKFIATKVPQEDFYNFSFILKTVFDSFKTQYKKSKIVIDKSIVERMELFIKSWEQKFKSDEHGANVILADNLGIAGAEIAKLEEVVNEQKNIIAKQQEELSSQRQMIEKLAVESETQKKFAEKQSSLMQSLIAKLISGDKDFSDLIEPTMQVKPIDMELSGEISHPDQAI